MFALRKAINIEPFVAEHRVSARAKRQLFAKLMDGCVAAVPRRARWQRDLVRPAAINWPLPLPRSTCGPGYAIICCCSVDGSWTTTIQIVLFDCFGTNRGVRTRLRTGISGNTKRHCYRTYIHRGTATFLCCRVRLKIMLVIQIITVRVPFYI